jgi:hypothetical protein
MPSEPDTDCLGFPVCMLCCGRGFVFYELPPHPYRWCGCVAGQHRRLEEPNLVDNANKGISLDV